MKITPIFLIISILQVSAKGYSQKTISFAVKDMPLEKVFLEIKKQSGFDIFYSDKELEGTKNVTLVLKEVTIEEALQECLKGQPLDYRIINQTISIRRKEEKPISDDHSSPPANLIDVKGQVLNEKNEKLEKASIEIKREKRGTFTDANGMFEIKNVDATAALIISFSGYESKEVNINGRQTVNISLSQNNSSLDGIQVIGYGTITKRLNTGDVSSIKSKEIEQQPVSNPLLALEGRIPGMQIAQGTGFPGSGVQVNIRGFNNFTGSNIPLFIVDGVPYPGQNLFAVNVSGFLGYTNGTAGNPLSYINPADIESIDVLKDADATAIYGTLGANGVVLITTKKGKAGKTKLDINMQSGWGTVAQKMKLLNTQEYLDMRNEAFKNDGTLPNPNADYDLTLWDTTRQTDWQKALLGGTAQYTDLEAALSGGSANTQFLIGTGYNKQTTVSPGDFNDQKGSVHFNINNTSIDQKFKISFSGLYLADHNFLSGVDLTQNALQLSPNAPAMYNADGSINWAPNSSGVSTWPFSNPAALLLKKYNINTNNLVGNSLLSYEILPGLFIKSSFGYTNTQTNNIQIVPQISDDPSTWSTIPRASIFNNNNIHSWILEPQTTYTRNISKGILNLLLGTTILHTSNASESLEATGFDSDQVMGDILSATTITVLSSLQSLYKYNAIFGRLNYNWLDKYLINLTARRDGSSRFGPDNEFHDFGAVGAAWIFSKERLIQQNLSFLSFGKLRGSYGTTGSDDVGDYTFMDLYSPISVGVPYQGANGIIPTRIYTPNLAWEETKKLEVGLELGFLQDRIMLTGDYYRNLSSNQLTGYSLPAIAGFTAVYKNLGAVVQNKGFEFEFRTINISGKAFRWTSSLNFTRNRNELLSGATGLSAYLQQKIGYSLFTTFVYHFLRVDPITGVDQFSTNLGKPTFTPNPATDMTIPIDVSIKYYGGFQNSIGYKGLTLDFLLQFSEQPEAPIYLYNYIPGYLNNSKGANQPSIIMNRWRQPGDVSPNQRFSQNFRLFNAYNYSQSSDQVYGTASFIRLKNVSFSWQVPSAWGQKKHIQSTRIFIQGQNLFTITRYQGLDPETTNSAVLPPLRVITLGAELNF